MISVMSSLDKIAYSLFYEVMKILQNLFFILLSCIFPRVALAQSLSSGLYPEPQHIVISNEQYTLDRGYVMQGISNPDTDAVKILKQVLPLVQSAQSLPLEIKKIKVKKPEMKRSGAYVLNITRKRIIIEIADDRSLFYAAQTLKQLVGRNREGKPTLPLCTITDYPDVLYRGSVEGFYGTPWSHADRISQLRFYGEFKLNTYIYGPKDDPFHSANWREPYPKEQADQIRELAEEAGRNKVDFVWAIHPGQDIKWNAADSSNVIVKFEQMYDLGVRSFAVFFDDISGEGTKADKQAGLMNFIQKEFVEKKKDIQPLIMCPTEYNRSWARTDYLDILGEQLHPAIHIMWTGDRVVDDITLEGVEWVNKRIRRPAYIWFNFPVNDYCGAHLLMGKTYGLDTRAANAMSGFVANPMEHAEASKVSLFGIAMYSWNIHNYDPQEAWEKACEYMMPEAAIAFKTFCENNGDPGANWHHYRREESVRYQTYADRFLENFRNGHFGEDEANQLAALFTQIQASPELIYIHSNNKELINEINPWLQQFELLGKCGNHILRMAHSWCGNDRQGTWRNFLSVSSIMDSMKVINRTFNQHSYQKGIQVGTKVLMPFIERLYRQTGRNLLSIIDTSSSEINMGTASIITNVEQLKNQSWSEEDNLIGYIPMFEVIKLDPEQYIGLGWELQKEAESFTFNLPQSNIEGRLFEWSADGKVWVTFSGIGVEQVNMTVTDVDPKARFVRMRNNTGKPMELKISSFSVKTRESSEIDDELLMYDLNLKTYKVLEPGDKVNVTCKDVRNIEFYMSGGSESRVSIWGEDKNGKINTLYCGYAGYVKLDRASLKNMQTLVISQFDNVPVLIHQIVKKY